MIFGQRFGSIGPIVQRMLQTFLLLKKGCRETPIFASLCSPHFLVNERKGKHDLTKSVVLVCCVTSHFTAGYVAWRQSTRKDDESLTFVSDKFYSWLQCWIHQKFEWRNCKLFSVFNHDLCHHDTRIFTKNNVTVGLAGKLFDTMISTDSDR